MLIWRENVFAFLFDWSKIGNDVAAVPKYTKFAQKVSLRRLLLKKKISEFFNLLLFTQFAKQQQLKRSSGRRRHSGKKLSCDRVLENNRAIHYCRGSKMVKKLDLNHSSSSSKCNCGSQQERELPLPQYGTQLVLTNVFKEIVGSITEGNLALLRGVCCCKMCFQFAKYLQKLAL